MSYSKELKEYIFRNKIKEQEIFAFLSGFLNKSLEKQENNFRITENDSYLVKGIYQLINQIGVNHIFEYEKNNNHIIITDNDFLEEIKAIKNGQIFEGIPHSIIKNEIEKRAYIKGIFIACGRISDPNKKYSLEFLLENEKEYDSLSNILMDYDIRLHAKKRGSKMTAYTKNSSHIVDFLNLIGATKKALELEDLKSLRQLKGDVNRKTNCETHNIEKTIEASIKQRKCIEKIMKKIGLKALSKELYDVAILRFENENYSLSEIGRALEPELSKSGVNHRMKKIMKICERLDK
ncbi:MAG: DNA-binding protein WhiA [Clostridiales bacterium]|nr:MAG: DNA-binding protein WhiA [Clostridiales bacterium]